MHHVMLAVIRWEEPCKNMLTELGSDAKILDVWRLSPLLGILSQTGRQQLLMLSVK